jgi:hypothetical protein
MSSLDIIYSVVGYSDDGDDLLDDMDDLGNVILAFPNAIQRPQRQESPSEDFAWDNDAIQSCWNHCIQTHDHNDDGAGNETPIIAYSLMTQISSRAGTNFGVCSSDGVLVRRTGAKMVRRR